MRSGNARIVKDPEEALEVNSEGIFEDEWVGVRRTPGKLPRGRWVRKFVSKVSRVARKEKAMDTEEMVFHLLTRYYL